MRTRFAPRGEVEPGTLGCVHDNTAHGVSPWTNLVIAVWPRLHERSPAYAEMGRERSRCHPCGLVVAGDVVGDGAVAGDADDGLRQWCGCALWRRGADRSDLVAGPTAQQGADCTVHQ